MPARDQPGLEPLCAPAVLMVRPAGFGFNQQTAASNALQRPQPGSTGGGTIERVLREFDELATDRKSVV